MSIRILQGDCRDVMLQMARDGVKVDSIVTDPPYELGFMGKKWDSTGIAFNPAAWALAFDLLKPGGHLFAFGGTRTQHRMVCAIEDAGFVIRDQFGWAYGSGFPKSHDISKAIDKAAGAERESIATGRPVKRMIPGADQARHGWEKNNGREYTPNTSRAATPDAAGWDGWGTAVKPAWEPVCLGQKPVEGTIAGNVLKHGTGALNIDGCRIGWPDGIAPEIGTPGWGGPAKKLTAVPGQDGETVERAPPSSLGRFPANLIHDGSEEVLEYFPDSDGQQFAVGPQHGAKPSVNTYGDYGARHQFEPRGDSGSAARFFYTAKADADDRFGSRHPTVKPVDLIRYFARLITPPGGLVLDMFAGSGTLGVAAIAEGFNAILIEREAEYIADIRERIAFYEGGDRHSMVSKNRNKTSEASPLFAAMGLDV